MSYENNPINEAPQGSDDTVEPERTGPDGAYIAKCVIVGLLAAVLGVVLLVQEQGGAKFAGVAVLAYAVWVLSGIRTGGWRLLIY